MARLLNRLSHLPADPPSLYIDLEGANLSRDGSISLLTLLVYPKNTVYIIDIEDLGEAAFTVTGADGSTLKDVLESSTIPKVFFTVQNISEALYVRYKVALQGVQDVQLMENASRTGHRSGKKFLNGLTMCRDRDAPINWEQKKHLKVIKEEGEKLFIPAKGGSYEALKQRPLHENIVACCLHDVILLPFLWTVYRERLTPEWKQKVEDETRARVLMAMDVVPKIKGADKALSPWQDHQPQLTSDESCEQVKGKVDGSQDDQGDDSDSDLVLSSRG